MSTYLNIEEVFGEDGGAVVDRLTLTIELATKHLSGDGHLKDVAGELAMRVRVVNVCSSFKDLIQRSRDVNDQSNKSTRIFVAKCQLSSNS